MSLFATDHCVIPFLLSCRATVQFPSQSGPESHRRRARQNNCGQRHRPIRQAERTHLNVRGHGKSRADGAARATARRKRFSPAPAGRPYVIARRVFRRQQAEPRAGAGLDAVHVCANVCRARQSRRASRAPGFMWFSCVSLKLATTQTSCGTMDNSTGPFAHNRPARPPCASHALRWARKFSCRKGPVADCTLVCACRNTRAPC